MCTVQYQVRFQVLTAASMKMTVFWNVAPCSLAEIERRSTFQWCLLPPLIPFITLTMEASVNFCETTRHKVPEDSHFQC
jgi:hypothetical protein